MDFIIFPLILTYSKLVYFQQNFPTTYQENHKLEKYFRKSPRHICIKNNCGNIWIMNQKQKKHRISFKDIKMKLYNRAECLKNIRIVSSPVSFP